MQRSSARQVIEIRRLEATAQGRTGYLGIIAVAENATGKGIGRLLMEAAENRAREQGYPSLLLDVFASNATARSFYRKIGFIEDSMRLRRTI